MNTPSNFNLERPKLLKYFRCLQDKILKKFYAIRFKLLNINSEVNHLYITTNLSIKVHDKAYYPFRYFTDFDVDMVKEMDSFLKLTSSFKCLIDIGAHYGIFSLTFSSRPNTTAFAIEPSPNAFTVLTENIKLNPKCNIIAYQICASHSLDQVEMSVGDADHFIAEPSKNTDSVVVDAITLDDFFLDKAVEPDVLKIDVEGFEFSVLKGAKNLLLRYHPMIFLEIHPQELHNNGTDISSLINFLDSLGYIFLSSRGQALKKTDLSNRTQVTRVLCKRG